jgi:hypothetical protein
MPSFTKGPNFRTPFGRNVFLRSTQDVKTTSYTLAMDSVPTVEIDGADNQKVLQPGTVLAKITSGDDAGKIGPFAAGATDGRGDTANIVGLNNTFLPWQLMYRDVEVAAVYECTAVQGWCLEYDGDEIVPLTDATADAMRGLKGLDIMFH